jgi:hypothetical protein
MFHNLPKNLGLISNEIKLSLHLRNTGIVPCENVIIEFKTHGGILLNYTKDSDDNDSLPIFPKPPVPPQGKMTRKTIADLMNMRLNIPNYLNPAFENRIPNSFDSIMKNITRAPGSRDKNAWYWKKSRPPKFSDSWVYECDEFRHKVEPEIFDIDIFIPLGKEINKGTFQCRVTAKNLPDPIMVNIPLSITYNNGDIIQIAQKILENGLKEAALSNA